MIRIAIAAEAFEAIKTTLPVGSTGYEAEPSPKGEVHVWLEPRVIDKLTFLRSPDETYSDVIVRIAAEH
jgi:hypothetical protein